MKKIPDHDRLAAAIYDGEGFEATGSALARAAARRVRRTRRTRRGLTVAFLMLLAAFIVQSRRNAASAPSTPLSETTAAVREPRASATTQTEIVSTEHMLALLSDRPVLIVQEANGHKRVVFLDEKKAH
jgi:hypothetical protein